MRAKKGCNWTEFGPTRQDVLLEASLKSCTSCDVELWVKIPRNEGCNRCCYVSITRRGSCQRLVIEEVSTRKVHN